MFEDDLRINTRPDYVDDGCDWTARHIFNMNARERVHRGVSSVMPECKQVVAKAKPVKKAKSKNKSRVFEFGDAA